MDRWRYVLGILAVCVIALGSGQAEAYTSKGKGTVAVSASGVTPSTTFTPSVVVQDTADTPADVDFGTGGNDFRDSGEAIKIVVSTNEAGNRVIIYTDNLGTNAVPKFCDDTSKGNDGGGLVGSTDCKVTVPVVWAVEDNNVDYVFAPNPVATTHKATGASNGSFNTDLAHVATFTAKNGTLDNLAVKFCSSGAAVANPAGDGLHPQFFGSPGADKDLCRVDTGAKVVEMEELSKNIAVVAFGFSGETGTAPILPPPPAPAPNTKTVKSPIYLPIGADFRDATAQNYATTTLTVDLVTQ